jgi:hypothetical protein
MSTDTERLNALKQHIDERLEYLARVLHEHEQNKQTTTSETFAYMQAMGERKALWAVVRVLAGGAP